MEQKQIFEWKPSEHELKLLESGYKKFLTPTIDCLNTINAGGEFQISLEYDNLKSKTKDRQSFQLFITNDKWKGLRFKIILPELLEIGGVEHKESYGLCNKLDLTQGDKKFIIKANSVTEFKTKFPYVPQILEGRFLHLMSANNEKDENNYFRLFIPVIDTEIIYPTSILEFTDNFLNFDIDEFNWHDSLLGLPSLSALGMFVNLKIKGYRFHFYAVEKMNAYIIDSIDKISKSDFIHITNIIRTNFAFLSGKFYRDEAIYFSSDDCDFKNINDFDIRVEEGSIISYNQIINPKFFFSTYESSNYTLQEKWKPFHKMFSSELFSRFCESLINIPELLRSIELINNASHISDPIQKGALYSVAIETITEHLKNEKEEKFNPITDNRISKKLRGNLLRELEKIKNEISEEGYNILTKKIQNINQPTNRDKLEKSFKVVGIILNSEEKGALDNRNDYLHGKKPIDTNERLELEKTSLQLHSLIGRLILRYINYEGHYIHLPSLHILKNKTLSDLFEKVDIDEFKILCDKAKNELLQDKNELKKAKALFENYKKILIHAAEMEKLIIILQDLDSKKLENIEGGN